MIVRCTSTHLRHLDKLAGDGVLAETFARDRTPFGRGQQVDIVAPYLAWVILSDRLMEKYLTPTLGRTPSMPTSALRFLARIAKSRNTIDRHPALKGAGMLGVQPGWFPVWVHDGPPSLVPIEYGVFQVWGARWHTHTGSSHVTTWDKYGIYPHNHWLTDEDVHRRLLPEQR